MTPEQKSIVLFWCGCIPVRLLLVWLVARQLSPQGLRWMAYAALVPAMGFLYYWWTGTRQTGAEVFGGRIWWNTLRPVHAGLYAAFAYSVLVWHNRGMAWKCLLADVGIGALASVVHHW